MTAQSQADFYANWNRQFGCPEQYDPIVSAAVWTEMLASDPVGATWGTGVRRAPQVPTWGVNQAVVAQDADAVPDGGRRTRQADRARAHSGALRGSGSPQKVIIDLACSSHNALWEKNRLLLFKASAEWLKEGKVGGVSEGEVKLGY